MTSHSPSTSVSDPAAESGSPRALVLSAWAACLVLSLWHAEELRDGLVESERTWLAALAEPIVAVSERTGLHSLGERTEALRATLYGVRAPSVTAAGAARPTLHTSTRASIAAVTPAHDIAQRPTSVLLVGASSMQFALGQALEVELARYEDLRVRRVGKVSTGLSRPDQFDWPQRLEQLLEQERPDLVVVNFGGNDAQNIPLPERKRAAFGSEAWDSVYGERVADFVGRIRAHGSQAVMIGMPIMRSADFSARMQRLNRVTEAATLHAGGIYLEQWDLAATPDGKYRELVDDGRVARPMRLPDGIHYSVTGGRVVAAGLMRRLQSHVRLVPKDRSLGVLERHGFHSAALGRPARYLAWLPRLAPGERVPLLVLLHGSSASPDVLAEHLQAQLATAAQASRIAIVAPDGGSDGWWLDSPERPASRYASLVAADLLADARANLPLSAASGIAGISMGGHGALTLALSHAGSFRSASSVSGVVDLTRAGDRPALIELLGPLDVQRERWQARSALHMLERAPAEAKKLALRVSCGAKDRWVGDNRAFHQRAQALGVAHDYDEAPFGHDWAYWQIVIPEHVVWHARVLTAR